MKMMIEPREESVNSQDERKNEARISSYKFQLSNSVITNSLLLSHNPKLNLFYFLPFFYSAAQNLDKYHREFTKVMLDPSLLFAPCASHAVF